VPKPMKIFTPQPFKMEDLFTQLNRGALGTHCKICGATVSMAQGRHLEWHNALNKVLNELVSR